MESLPPDERNKYDSNMQNEFDKRTEKLMIKEEAFAAGILKGKAEGEAKGKAEVAKNLLEIGMDIHQIVLVTGLTEEQIKDL